MRILLVSPYLPHALVGHGGGTVIYHFCKQLACEHEVLVLCFQRSEEEGFERDLEDSGVKVETVFFRSGNDRGFQRILTLFDRGLRLIYSALSGRPYRSIRYQHRGMERSLRRLIKEWQPDIIDLEFFAMAPYARLIKKMEGEQPRISLTTHEVETLVRTRAVLSAPPGPKQWMAELILRKIHRFESTAVHWADCVFCVSEQDRQVLQSISGASKLHTLPLGVSLDDLPQASLTFEGPPRLLFVGSFDHPPNREAALWIAEELVPYLRRHLPDLICEIAGRNPPTELRLAAAASHGGVVVHGFVDDLIPLYERSWLFTAPLFSGGGIKIKILETLARGMPVLTTPIGLDGIDAEKGKAIVCADDASAFFGKTLELLEDREKLASMGQEGRAYIAASHDWPALAHRFVATVSQS